MRPKPTSLEKQSHAVEGELTRGVKLVIADNYFDSRVKVEKRSQSVREDFIETSSSY